MSQRADEAPIPVTVIGGYLGAGKTTLLNQLLHHNQGQRTAVLVNDFGAVSIDAQLITSHEGDTISLANGCICCSLAAGFLNVLTALRARVPAPERIVVEASGVALPQKIAQYGRLPGFRLEGVIVLVDAETIRTRACDRLVGKTVRRQLEGADLLVLTKTDLISAQETAAVRAWLRARVPDTPLVMAEQGHVPLSVVFGAGAAAPPSEARGLPEDAALPHDIAHDTVSLRWEQPVPEDAFQAFAAALPTTVLRGKGIIWLAEHPDRQMIFQRVGKRWSLTPGDRWGAEPAATHVVFIGPAGALDAEQVRRQFMTTVGDDSLSNN
ncbi:MAG: GTP-binding protein [Thermomicrobiales bacterium]